MHEYDSVLCFCPPKRMSAVTLALSTWTGVRRFVLTDDERRVEDADEHSVVMVMDCFVSGRLVRRAAARRPVIILAWNGLFEIDRYRRALDDFDLLYLGTEASLPASVPVRYLPIIDGACSFAQWRDLYRNKRQFVARGGTSYLARWARTQLLPVRGANIAISALSAVLRPRALVDTLASGFVRDKLLWAGECVLDPCALGLDGRACATVTAGIAKAATEDDPERRLGDAIELIREWQADAPSVLGPAGAHQALFVTSTLLRWAVLTYLQATVAESTWFFGRDNLGVGLEHTLYLHNLAPAERVAYLELGGTKTSGSGLYPRSLHLLAREFYVIPVLAGGDGSQIIAMIDRLRQALTDRRREFFEVLEQRRRALYDSICSGDGLGDVQRRVWNDFAAVGDIA